MTAGDLVAMLPIIAPAATAVAVMLLLCCCRSHRATLGLTLAGLVWGLAMLPVASLDAPRQVTALFVVDGYALFFLGLILAASLVVALISYGYLAKRGGEVEESYLLLLLATTGAAVLVAADHFASFFLGLEVLSVSLYGMIAYRRGSLQGIEAGIKYLVLAAASAAFLLFGMALIYAVTGTMSFAEVWASGRVAGSADEALVVVGLALLLVGIGFKLALVPFHLWTPDVYQGAPAPVAAFVATVSKGAVFAFLLRHLGHVGGPYQDPLQAALSLVAVASMFAGNLLALLQDNVKRILAYSSIAHLGYLLVAFLASGRNAVTAASVYLLAYFVTTLGAWGVVAALSRRDGDAEALGEYRGLAWRRPWLAGVFVAMLLSLAGIPLTAGFIGKFYLIAAGVGSSLWVLVISLVVSSAIGLYYYLRIIVTLFARPENEAAAPAEPVPLGTGLALTLMTGLLLWLGVYPGPFLNLLASLAGRMR